MSFFKKFTLYIIPLCVCSLYSIAQNAHKIIVEYPDIPSFMYKDTTNMTATIVELKMPKGIEEYLISHCKKLPYFNICIVIVINKIPYIFNRDKKGNSTFNQIATGSMGFEGDRTINDIVDVENLTKDTILIVGPTKLKFDWYNRSLSKLRFKVPMNEQRYFEAIKSSEYDFSLNPKLISKNDQIYTITITSLPLLPLSGISKTDVEQEYLLHVNVAGDSTKKEIINFITNLKTTFLELNNEVIQSMVIIRYREQGVLAPESLKLLLKED